MQTEFQKLVKHRLIDMGKTQAWLIEEVKARTGRPCDRAKILRCTNGTTKRSPVITAIREILDLPEE